MSRRDGQDFHDPKAGCLVRRRKGEAEVFTAETQGRGEKSQGDFIIQPSVDAMPSRLRWVVDQKIKSTPLEIPAKRQLADGARVCDPQPLRQTENCRNKLGRVDV